MPPVEVIVLVAVIVVTLVGEAIVKYLVIGPYVAACQAAAGMLHPTGSKRLRRLQVLIVILLAGGVAAIAVALSLDVFGGRWGNLSLPALGIVSLYGSGLADRYIESRSAMDDGNQSPPESSPATRSRS